MSENKRKQARITTMLHLNIAHMDDAIVCIGTTLNISTGGCCVLCEQELQQDDYYKLLFRFTETSTLSIVAKVAYQYPDSGIYKTGFEFNSNQDLKEWLNKFQ